MAVLRWQEKRERNYCFINMRRAMLIHRVEVEVEVEKMMEEAIAKSLRAWGAPLHPSLHLRDEKWCHFQPSLAFLSKISGLVHTWADNLNCELSSFNIGVLFFNHSRLNLTYFWCSKKYNNWLIGSSRFIPLIMAYYIARIGDLQ